MFLLLFQNVFYPLFGIFYQDIILIYNISGLDGIIENEILIE